VRVQVNAPRFKENAPSECRVRCDFAVDLVAEPWLRQVLGAAGAGGSSSGGGGSSGGGDSGGASKGDAADSAAAAAAAAGSASVSSSGDSTVLSVHLPVVTLSRRRGWCTVVDRSGIVRALQGRCGGVLNSVEVDSVLGALQRVAMVFVCPGITTSSGSSGSSGSSSSSTNNNTEATKCGLERIEVTSSEPLPATVREWLHSTELKRAAAAGGGGSGGSDNVVGRVLATAIVTAASAVDAAAVPSELMDTFAQKMCICWPCMRLKLAGAQADDAAAGAAGETPGAAAGGAAATAGGAAAVARQFKVGTMVSLSSTYASPANIDAATGPLRRGGQFGIVVEVDTADVPQPVLVRAFTGEAAWCVLLLCVVVVGYVLAGRPAGGRLIASSIHLAVRACLCSAGLCGGGIGGGGGPSARDSHDRYSKGALVPLPEPSLDLNSGPSGSGSGGAFDAVAAGSSVEAFARGLDSSGGVCRIVQPLTQTELRQHLQRLNESLLHVPVSYVG
jgi:hypothetical protein